MQIVNRIEDKNTSISSAQVQKTRERNVNNIAIFPDNRYTSDALSLEISLFSKSMSRHKHRTVSSWQAWHLQKHRWKHQDTRLSVMWADTWRVLKGTEYNGKPYQSARTTPCHRISLLHFPPTHSVTEIQICPLPQRGGKKNTNFKHAEASWRTRRWLSWRKTIKWSTCRADGLLLLRHVFQRRNRWEKAGSSRP